MATAPVMRRIARIVMTALHLTHDVGVGGKSPPPLAQDLLDVFAVQEDRDPVFEGHSRAQKK